MIGLVEKVRGTCNGAEVSFGNVQLSSGLFTFLVGISVALDRSAELPMFFC
jgi:hypothetical protein